ncbi:hypothetical protein AWT69_004881 [Pseudomonas putida]|nr:hypothetical protein AWT69_004881 [Pseudomonas putida]
MANNAFDDGDNSAHWTLRATCSVGFHAWPAFEAATDGMFQICF